MTEMNELVVRAQAEADAIELPEGYQVTCFRHLSSPLGELDGLGIDLRHVESSGVVVGRVHIIEWNNYTDGVVADQLNIMLMLEQFTD